MTLVSLIMPVGRPRSDWLHDAVASALDEGECEIELIVVDDGNEQPVADMLADVDDSRLRIIRVAHGGPYAARNAGMAVARGDHVRFVDSDDIVEPGSTGRLLAVSRSAGQETVAYGWTMICDETMRPTELVAEQIEGDIAEQCLLGQFDVYVVSMVYPRAVLERAGPWAEKEYRVSGDSDYVQRVVEQAPVQRLDEVVTHYRRHATSVSKTARIGDAVCSGLLTLERYFERHPEQRGSKLQRQAYTNLHLLRARSYLAVGEVGASLRQLALASKWSPAQATAAMARFTARKLGWRPPPGTAQVRFPRLPRNEPPGETSD